MEPGNQLVKVREFSFGQLSGLKRVFDCLKQEDYASLLTLFDAGLLYFLETHYGGKEVVEAATRLARQHGGVEGLKASLQKTTVLQQRISEAEKNVRDLENRLGQEQEASATLSVEFDDYKRKSSDRISDAESAKTKAEERARVLERQIESEQRISQNTGDELAKKTTTYESDISKLTEDVTRLTNQNTLDASAHQTQLGELQEQYNTSQRDLEAARKKYGEAEEARKKAEARAVEVERKYSKLEQEVKQEAKGSVATHEAELEAKDIFYKTQLGEAEKKLNEAGTRIEEYESGVVAAENRLLAEKVKGYEEELSDARQRADTAEGRLTAAEAELGAANQRVQDAENAMKSFYNQAKQAISGRAERGRKVPRHNSEQVKI